MRATFSRWSIVGAVAGFLLFGITGCKTGATTAPSDWFSWGKKPSPTALSSTAPKKPSTSLPSPQSAVGGQAALANNAYQNYGSQGTSGAAASGTPNTYNTGPYGMASHSTPTSSPYGQAGGTNGQFASQTQSPYGTNASPYGTAGSSQPGAYPAGDNGYRTADTRSGVAPSAFELPANGASGQTYGQPASQNWDTQAAATYPSSSTTSTTGLSNATGPYQPGSTGSAGALPINGGSTNTQQSAPANYPGKAAPTNYPSSSSSGSYSGSNYQSAPANTYPQAGAGGYPTTSGTGQGYSPTYSQ